jgi:hypothetical protein
MFLSSQGDLKVAAKQGCKGRQPLDGARGALALSHFPAAFGGKKGLVNGPAFLLEQLDNGTAPLIK